MRVPRSIISPTVDALCAGGASLAAAAALLALGPSAAGPIVLARFSMLSVLINWPHFMASYHLLYTAPDAFKRYPAATLYVPAALCAYALAAAALFGREPLVFYSFHAVAAVYLAWHYTGQTWGMISAFAHLEGLQIDAPARRLLKLNLRSLLAWHAAWALHTVAEKLYFTGFGRIYGAAGVVALASMVPGAWGLWRLRRAGGRLPPRVLLPWLALHSWYLLLYVFPKALFWVQLSHASQYLIFPLRVQANRDSSDLGKGAGYYAALVVSGVVAFKAAPHAANLLAGWAGSAVPASVILVDLLNIHHYFVDSRIWKLSVPEVRRDLFRHLEPAPSTAS